MPFTRLALLGALGLLGLAACNKPGEVQPPISGTAAGPGSPQITQISREQPHSSSVSAGVPQITGSTGTSSGERAGGPTVTYSGQGAGSLSPGVPQVTGSTGTRGGDRPGGPSVTYR